MLNAHCLGLALSREQVIPMTSLTFSPNFLRPSTATMTTVPEAERLSYLHSADGEITKFAGCRKGQQLLDEFTENVGALKQFMTRSDPDHAQETNRKFDFFLDRLKEGPTGYFSTELAVIYGPGKRALDQLCFALASGRVSRDRGLSRVRELAKGIGVCAPGVSTNLMLAAQGLYVDETVALHAKETLTDQID
jgi:hypothetical protein